MVCFPTTASSWGNEPAGDADRPGPRPCGGDEPGAGHVQSSGDLQPLLCLQHLSTQEERPGRYSPESCKSLFPPFIFTLINRKLIG